MFRFLHVMTETPIMKLLGILLFIGLCYIYPDIGPWFQESRLGEEMVTKGLWPQDAGRQFLTLVAILIISSVLFTLIIGVGMILFGLLLWILGWLALPLTFINKSKKLQDNHLNIKANMNPKRKRRKPYKIRQVNV